MPRIRNGGIQKRCDCAHRQWPKCAHPWHFNFFFRGVRHRYSLEFLARARNELPPTTKTEAEGWRDRLRHEIRTGVFVDPGTAPPPAVPADDRLTLGDVIDRYLAAHVDRPTRRAAAGAAMRWTLDLISRTEIPAAAGTRVALRDKAIADITSADVEAFRAVRRSVLAESRERLSEAVELEQRAASREDEAERRALRRKARDLRASAKARPGRKGGEVGINRLLARLRHVFTWAVKRGFLTAHPFRLHGEVIVELETRAETARTRRLEPHEEEALLTHAGPHLRALIVAALHTGCRKGELLSLQWGQIRRTAQGAPKWIVLSAERTKTNESRTIPIGDRLRAELEMRRHGPDGKDLAADAYVFGNEVGEPVESISTAWRATCRRAGIRDLHFHDLRREFASRLMETGAEQHAVRDFLGHANITTTSRYLRSTPLHLERALEQLERSAVTSAGLPQDCHTDPKTAATDLSQPQSFGGNNSLIQ